MSRVTTGLSTADRFNVGAGIYAKVWAPVLLPHCRHLLAQVPLAGARRVVVIATGTGSLLPDIRAAAPDAFVVGVDLARGMIALAPPGSAVAAMDVARLAFRDAAFDAATMCFAIFFVPAPEAAFAEVRRVLRPGGAFALTSFHGEPEYVAYRVWVDEIVALGATPAPWARQVIEPAALAEALARAGFTGVRTSVGRFDHQYRREDFLAMRLAMSARWLATLADDVRDAFVARIRRRFDALSPDDLLDRTEIIYAVATRAT